MNYKHLVQQIADLDWAKVSPTDIILLSLCTAREFSASLRLAKQVYPNDACLDEMMEGELQTDNMAFEDYTQKGAHWEFLDYFVTKHGLTASTPALVEAMKKYLADVSSLSDAERAMTIFSREES